MKCKFLILKLSFITLLTGFSEAADIKDLMFNVAKQ